MIHTHCVQYIVGLYPNELLPSHFYITLLSLNIFCNLNLKLCRVEVHKPWLQNCKRNVNKIIVADYKKYSMLLSNHISNICLYWNLLHLIPSCSLLFYNYVNVINYLIQNSWQSFHMCICCLFFSVVIVWYCCEMS